MLGHRKLSADDYVAILKRRRLLIIIPALILPIAAYAITFFIPSQFLSQSLVLVEDKKVPDELVRSIITTGLATRLAAMREQALSRSRLEPIVQRYNLYQSKHLSMDDRIDLIRKSIAILPIKSDINRAGGLPGFTISYTAGDAHTAQQVCAEVTSLFISENLQQRQTAAMSTTDFLKKQLDDAKISLDQQDAKLAEFQQKYIGKLPGQAASNGNMLSSLSTQLDSANQALSRMEQDRELQSSLLAQQLQRAPAPTVSSTGVPSTTPQAEQIELTALLEKEADLTAHYTDSYPDVISVRRKIADVRKKIAAQAKAPAASAPAGAVAYRNDDPAVAQLRAQLRAADVGIKEKQREQAQIQHAISEYQSRIESSPLVEEKYKELTRGNETARNFYDELLNKINRSKMATDLERGQEGEQFTVMDGANLPDDPVFPKRWLFAIGGVILGLGLGMAIAALLEYKDTSLRTEQDVWAFTRLPTLAVIAFSGALVIPETKPGLWARFKGLFRRKLPPPTSLPADDFEEAKT